MLCRLPALMPKIWSQGSNLERRAPKSEARMFPGYSRNSRWLLPLKIFALSPSDSGMSFIQSVAGGLSTKGQSTANRIWSTPISMTQHSSAGLEKLPLVVIQKLLQNTSRKPA